MHIESFRRACVAIVSSEPAVARHADAGCRRCRRHERRDRRRPHRTDARAQSMPTLARDGRAREARGARRRCGRRRGPSRGALGGGDRRRSRDRIGEAPAGGDALAVIGIVFVVLSFSSSTASSTSSRRREPDARRRSRHSRSRSTGCAASPPLADGLRPRRATLDRAPATPFFPQEDYQCGPAALATLLRRERPRRHAGNARAGSLRPGASRQPAARDDRRDAPPWPAAVCAVDHGR